MNLDEYQNHVAACLAANSFFAELTILCEFDPLLTPAQLAEQDAKFEAAVTTKGVVVVVLSPFAASRDYSRGAGVALTVTVPVVVVENPEVNRGAVDPSGPLPFGKPALRIQQAVIGALVSGGYHFPPGTSAIEWPTIGVDGLLHYRALPTREHTIRAS